MKEIHITKDTQEAGIAFVLPGQQIFAYMEKPGSKNIAIRMAVEDAIEFFTQRYMEYHTALKNVNDALTAASADDPAQVEEMPNMSTEELERLFKLDS